MLAELKGEMDSNTIMVLCFRSTWVAQSVKHPTLDFKPALCSVQCLLVPLFLSSLAVVNGDMAGTSRIQCRSSSVSLYWLTSYHTGD